MCPHCGKQNPVPVPLSATVDTCQWCNEEYEFSKYQLEFDEPLQSSLVSAQDAYEAWVGAGDDFFNVDDEGQFESDFIGALERLFEEMETSGLVVSDYEDELEQDFPAALERQSFQGALDRGEPPVDQMRPSSSERGVASQRASRVISRRCSKCEAVVAATSSFCDKCGEPIPAMQAADLMPLIQKLQEHVSMLQQSSQRESESSVLPATNLLSRNFLTRAFAVYGHALVAGAIIGIPLYLLTLIILVGMR